MSKVIRLSVVASMYKSATYLDEFCARSFRAAEQAGYGDAVEIVLVNDGSTDDSLERAVELHERDPRIVVVDLARNYGHHKAMMTGLAVARGERIYLLDCDLEEEPEWLARFGEALDSTGADAAFGVQTSRKGGLFERVSGELFYSASKWLFGVELPRNLVTARLMTRRYVRALVAHRDHEPLFSALCKITGFRQEAVVIKKHHLHPTSYSLWRKLSLLMTTMTGFSARPLYFITLLGGVVTVGAFLYILWVVGRWLFGGAGSIPGWTSTVCSIWLVGGLIMLCLGVSSLYIGRIFEEVKRRPYVTVRAVFGGDGESCEPPYPHVDL